VRRPATWLALAILATGLSAMPATAKKKPGPNPADTQRAITLLLAMAEEPIPSSSSCYGRYGGDGPPKVKDMLGMELASLSRGQNKVAGHCTAQRCAISIAHHFGEDVSSADVSFDVEGGRGQPNSLTCVLTP
jgi:hypothetical protein